MYIDYVRIYQRDDAPGIGCSPEDYPTEAYIKKYEHLSFHLDCKVLTRKQPFERIFEPQSHNVEPSRVLFPAQLVIPRLLDERHDMLRSFTPSPRDPSRRSRCNSIPPPIFLIIRRDGADRFPTVRGTHDHHITLSHDASTPRIDLQAHALLSYPQHGYSSMNSVLPCFLFPMLFRFFALATK